MPGTINSCDYSPTQHAAIVGGANGQITSISPSSTSGVPLISQGSSSDPTFGTAVVAGGGTGSTSFNINGAVYSGTTTTGSLQSATLSSGQLLIGGTTAPAAAALSAANGMNVANGNNSITLSNLRDAARYVVSPTSGQAGYMTIQSAINQAVTDGASSSTPATVWIWPGTYTENLTINSFVSLVSAAGGQPKAIVIGNAVYTPAANGYFSAENINFQTPVGGSSAFSIQGTAGSTTAIFTGCEFNGTTGTGFECLNGSINVWHYNCTGRASASQKVLNINKVRAFYSYSPDYVSNNTQSTIANASVVNFFGGNLVDSYLVSGTAEVFFYNCLMFSVGAFSCVDLSTSGCTGSFFGGSAFTLASHWVNGIGRASINGVSSYLGTAIFSDPGLNYNLIAPSQFMTTTSNPPSLDTETTNFGNSLTVGTATQNTNGHNILLQIAVAVSSATTATITVGVGPTSTPTADTVIPSFSTASAVIYTFSVVIPNLYYVLVNTTGTITVSSVTCVATGF